MPPVAAKPSKVEGYKLESRSLRGSIAETLVSDAVEFAESDKQLLKFHGSYQGYDRDSATERKNQGLSKAIEFMVRAKIPGGKLTAAQFVALDRLAQDYSADALRITTRQGLQFHGIVKDDLRASIAAINDTLLTTLGACGDVVRNVTASPAPVAGPVQARLQDDARRLSDALTPRTRGYHEIWLGEERVDTAPPSESGDETDPLYRDVYLPRKFKIGIATPEDNTVDVLTNDLGIIALFEGDRLTGYNLAVGGGLGMTHNKPSTYPRLATPVVFIEPDELIEGVKAVVALHRDYGDRTNRKHARLKYVVDELGLDWVKTTLEGFMGKPLEAARPMPRFEIVDHMGWHEQGDGRWYLGLPVANGRVKDIGDNRLRSALLAIFERFVVEPILMPTQDILITEVAPEDRAAIDAVLAQFGVPLPGDVLPVERWAMACPALPTCGLALNEAERIRVPLVAEIAKAMDRHGLAQERLSIRITGCPNGCARPYAGDIGLVGRTPNEYAIYLGGDFEGTRLNRLAYERVHYDRIADTLEPLFAAFVKERQPGEGFGDWHHRTHPASPAEDAAA